MPAPSAPIHRRRRNLLVAALAAFAIGVTVGATTGGDATTTTTGGTPPNESVPPAAAPPAEPDPVAALTLRQQVGQVIVLRFAGTTPPDYVTDALRERRAAGVILFRDNVTSPAQLRTLTRRLRRARRAARGRRRPGGRGDPDRAVGAAGRRRRPSRPRTAPCGPTRRRPGTSCAASGSP